MHWPFVSPRPTVAAVVMTQQRNIVTRTWGSSVGKKSVMAVTGVIFLLYVIAHMLGNLKIFFGIEAFNGYSVHLRTLLSEFVGYGGLLWVIRTVLGVAVVLHMWAAFSLWYKAKKARPVGYAHRGKLQGSYAARTMRWGGVILALFIIWHILDITLGVVNPLPENAGAYQKLVASFERPVVSVFYIAAMVALGFHIKHGMWSAMQTLGGNSALRQNSLKALSFAVAAVVTVGFVIIPVFVMIGLVK